MQALVRLVAASLLLCGIPIEGEARPPAPCPPGWADGDTWRTVAPLPSPRWRLGAAAVRGKIYAVGGRGAAVALDAVDEYDPRTNTWRPRGTSRRPTCGATSSAWISGLS